MEGCKIHSIVGEHADIFVIDQSGTVIVQNPDMLDREVYKEITFQVKAQDGGEGENQKTTSVPVSSTAIIPPFSD